MRAEVATGVKDKGFEVRLHIGAKILMDLNVLLLALIEFSYTVTGQGGI